MCKRDKIKGDKGERGGKGGVPLTDLSSGPVQVQTGLNL